ncbi:hypothetical protein SNEBB_002781 [Seison nebaliae]|nr:hypothetical protein SNEBB_002781 [Seison nebaliae]
MKSSRNEICSSRDSGIDENTNSIRKIPSISSFVSSSVGCTTRTTNPLASIREEPLKSSLILNKEFLSGRKSKRKNSIIRLRTSKEYLFYRDEMNSGQRATTTHINRNKKENVNSGKSNNRSIMCSSDNKRQKNQNHQYEHIKSRYGTSSSTYKKSKDKITKDEELNTIKKILIDRQNEKRILSRKFNRSYIKPDTTFFQNTNRHNNSNNNSHILISRLTNNYNGRLSNRLEIRSNHYPPNQMNKSIDNHNIKYPSSTSNNNNNKNNNKHHNRHDNNNNESLRLKSSYQKSVVKVLPWLTEISKYHNEFTKQDTSSMHDILPMTDDEKSIHKLSHRQLVQIIKDFIKNNKNNDSKSPVTTSNSMYKFDESQQHRNDCQSMNPDTLSELNSRDEEIREHQRILSKTVHIIHDY